MANTLRIDMANGKLIMDAEFAKRVSRVGSPEYKMLQEAKRDNPDYIVVKKTIKRNPSKETYAGLTYNYMRYYITKNEPAGTLKHTCEEFEELLLISKCHSRGHRYPTIKNWFLNKYPEIVQFGMPTLEYDEKAVERELSLVS